ncbi:MAG: MarR family winged helix-turn-helix transcriptional regulator [Actinomycetes bacterium]
MCAYAASNTTGVWAEGIGRVDGANRKIEQQMTRLLRRSQRIHLSTGAGAVYLERSAYGILCQLADEGPQRLGSLATTFGLDPSTITRQVRALEDAGLATRARDTSDRRASILDLTPEGRDILDRTRARRRQRLREAMHDWTDEERVEFGRLLAKFNVAVDRFTAEQD